MGAAFGAEFLKLRKRPATWVLVLLYVALTILFGYVIGYVFYLLAESGALGEGDFEGDPREFLVDSLPNRVVGNVLGGVPFFGGVIAIILGALVVGSEYGWGTLKTTLTQSPSRLSVFLGKLLALAVVLALLVVAIFAAGVGCSALIAAIEGEPMQWPPVSDWLRGFGAAWLIFAMWCAFGVMLATLTRGTAFAIGAGLAWAFVVEGLIVGLFSALVNVLETIREALPGANAGSLAAAVGSTTQGEAGAPGVVDAVSGTRATLVLVAYLVVFLAVSAWVLRRRDVT